MYCTTAGDKSILADGTGEITIGKLTDIHDVEINPVRSELMTISNS